MHSLLPNFTKPLKLRHPEAEKTRHATWTELFYDLVFVIAIAQLGHNLSNDISIAGVLAYIVLFIPIWRVWVHHTYYADRFDPDDTLHRILTFAQMVAIAILAASVEGALGDSSKQFALSLAIVRLILILMYNRARNIEEAKPLVRRLMLTLSFGAGFWFISIFIPTPWRFLFWAVALISEVIISYIPSTRAIFASMPVSHTHVPERFGLFTIIFLGELVAGMVAGLSEHEFALVPYAIAALGFVITFSLWSLYFENVKETTLQKLGVFSGSWIYMHLPFMMGLAALGVAIEHAIASAGEHGMDEPTVYLLTGTLAIVFVSLGYLHRILARFEDKQCHIPQSKWRFNSAVLVLLIGYFVTKYNGTPLLLISLLGLLTLAQVIGDALIHQVDQSEGAELSE